MARRRITNNPFIDSPSNDRYDVVHRKQRHSTLLDEAPSSESNHLPFDSMQLPSKFLGALAVLAMLVLIGRSFGLQIVQGAQRRDQAENNRIRREILPAMRGLILDRNGQALVKNVPNFTLLVAPSLLPKPTLERTDILSKLALNTGMTLAEIQDILSASDHTNQRQIILRDNLSYDQALRFETIADQLPGCSLQAIPVREYYDGPDLAHAIGYIGRVTDNDIARDPGAYTDADYIGKTGIELAYENELRGQHGYRDVERDHVNREKRVLASAAPIAGKNLLTTLDRNVQKALSNALNKVIEQTQAPGGAAVALDPRNGNVLALVSSPSYDNNALVRGISPEEYAAYVNDPSKPFLNRAVSGEYPSGSTIKPLIASAALQEHLITSSTIIQSTGGIALNQWFFPDWKSGGHGPTNLTKALAESVNTYFYTIGGGNGDQEGLGVDRLNRYMNLFGLSNKLGIDIPNERPGFLPTKDWKKETKHESWYIGDTYHYAIGQGDVLVTPLQMAAATAVVANGGTLYQPHIAQAWLDPQLNIISELKPNGIRDDVIDPANLAAVRQGLREAVVSGSAVALQNFPVEVAAKTGTAEVGETGDMHAWFTAFAPYETPEIVISVVVEQGGQGHASALPVAKAGLEAFFAPISNNPAIDSQP